MKEVKVTRNMKKVNEVKVTRNMKRVMEMSEVTIMGTQIIMVILTEKWGWPFQYFPFNRVHLFALIWFNFRVLLILNVNYDEYMFNFFFR